jgi:hypothetical protein
MRDALIPDIAEPVIGRAFARPVGSPGLRITNYTRGYGFLPAVRNCAPGRNDENWLAGAGGIEPPNGGIKIRLNIKRFQGAFGKKAKVTL